MIKVIKIVKKFEITLTIILLSIFSVPYVLAGMYYEGNLELEEENIEIEVSYIDEKAILNVDATYILKNTGNEEETVDYDYYFFGEKIDGEEITINKGESKTLSFTNSKTLTIKPYSVTIDLNVLLNGKFIGKMTKRGEFTLKFSSKPTITSMNPEPTNSDDLTYEWVKEDYIPVFNIRLSWIKEIVNVNLKKEITPNQVKKNDIITIKSYIKNNDDIPYEAKIVDTYRVETFSPVDESKFTKAVPESPIEPSHWVFEKEFSISPGEEKIFVYELKFLGLDINEMNLEGFRLSIPEKNFYKQSDRTYISIDPCDGDGICDELESYNTCPEDCQPLSTTEETTTTKMTTTTAQLCNKNKKCEIRQGENYDNCPEDCSSGILDKYCDGVADGTCDPDCIRPDQDPDCIKGFRINWIYILFGVIIVVSLIVFFANIKKETIEK